MHLQQHTLRPLNNPDTVLHNNNNAMHIPQWHAAYPRNSSFLKVGHLQMFTTKGEKPKTALKFRTLTYQPLASTFIVNHLNKKFHSPKIIY